jgi:hypothetical protein
MINIAKTSGIVTVTDTGLPKSYFNPTCSYTASSNNDIVYFKVNNDSYEIPLAKLQVSGSSQASLSTALTSITSLLTA